MPSYTQTWFIDGECLGTFPCELEHTCNILHPPESYAFACPSCGDIWARRAILPSTHWFFWNIHCPGCKAKAPISGPHAGSIWLSWDNDYLLHLPLPVLRYEALRCLTNWG